MRNNNGIVVITKRIPGQPNMGHCLVPVSQLSVELIPVLIQANNELEQENKELYGFKESAEKAAALNRQQNEMIGQLLREKESLERAVQVYKNMAKSLEAQVSVLEGICEDHGVDLSDYKCNECHCDNCTCGENQINHRKEDLPEGATTEDPNAENMSSEWWAYIMSCHK